MYELTHEEERQLLEDKQHEELVRTMSRLIMKLDESGTNNEVAAELRLLIIQHREVLRLFMEKAMLLTKPDPPQVTVKSNGVEIVTSLEAVLKPTNDKLDYLARVLEAPTISRVKVIRDPSTQIMTEVEITSKKTLYALPG